MTSLAQAVRTRRELAPPRFEPPGPGPWKLDDAHADEPAPRYAQEPFVRGFMRGQAEGFARAGVPLRTIELAFVHGLAYWRPVPLVGRPDAGPPPPRWLLKGLTRLHPATRARAGAARRWLSTRGWRADVARWDTQVMPSFARRLGALQAAPITTLDARGLVAHLDACLATLEDAHTAHFSINPAVMFPVGALLRVAAGAGIAPAELARRLVARRKNHELSTLAAALRRDDVAAALLTSGAPAPRILERLEAQDGEVGDAARAWLGEVRHRALAARHLLSPTGDEVPELLLDHIRDATRQERAHAGEDRGVEALRARVPAGERDRFDALLTESTLVHRVRDERSSVLDRWAEGVTRRALLEAGRRLADGGRIDAPEHALDLDHAELTGLLARGAGPDAAEVRERAMARATTSASAAPASLGGAHAPAPEGVFPEPVERLLAAIFFYVGVMDGPEEMEVQTGLLLRGVAASSGRYEGPARVVSGDAPLSSLRAGEVLVARTTMPGHDVVFPLAGAVVTDRGGALSHAAIVARELGIPAVVGTREATVRLRTGERVRVDGDAGTVERA